MKYITPVVWLTVALLCNTSAVLADELRVLMSFDGSGHQVRKVVRVGVDEPLALQAATESKNRGETLDIAALTDQLRSGFASLVWLDAYNQYIIAAEPDPRISHAPAHINGYHGARSGDQTGAWLVSGPVWATKLMILLPGDPSLGLGFEEWTVSLTDG